jgi:response regulator RpfG family c-di-GMP phosphodiesterase
MRLLGRLAPDGKSLAAPLSRLGFHSNSEERGDDTRMSTTLGRRARVLIADDEPEIREVLIDLLSVHYDCTTVSSAEEALARLRAGAYDLVISDIMMGGMSGLEMIPHVLSTSPDIVVIMISGVQTVESAINALRAGAFDYVMKPFDIHHVEAAVSRALEHHYLRVDKRRYENFLEQMVGQRTAELDNALRSLEDAYRTTLKALTAALETRDQETHGHSERVVNFSLRLGQELSIDVEQMRALEFGSLLHDIGKIGVPDAILRKPAALSEDEWTRMREHPLHGQKILHGINFLEGAARVVAQHHEKWDGSGYPLGLRSEDIDLNARIFAVADAFDAMTSDRVYRRGRSYEEAVTELKDFAGRQFDPHVVEAFCRVPREEWDEIRRRSLEARELKAAARRLEQETGGLYVESGAGVLVN